jgi:hypothetical protein
MIEDISWLFGALAVSLVIQFVGYAHGRSLPLNIVRLNRERFRFLSLIPILAVIPFYQPELSSISHLDFDTRIIGEQLTHYDKEKTEQFENLRADLKSFREDFIKQSKFLQVALFFAAWIGAVICINLAKSKKAQITELLLDEKHRNPFYYI